MSISLNHLTPVETDFITHLSSKTAQEIANIKYDLDRRLFRIQPPTPEQFLDPAYQWLPQIVTDSIYDHVKTYFCDIINGKTHYEQVVLYGATRLGKSTLARLLIMYTIVFVHSLRNPNAYFNCSPMSYLAIYLISFKHDKTREIYVQPLFHLLDASEKFYKVDRRNQVQPEQASRGLGTIVYSEASLVGEITLGFNLNIVIGNQEVLSILGADIIQAYLSEITFFIKNAGATEESIFTLYSKVVGRIRGTVGKSYLSFTYLDSSAHYAESTIEKYIINELSKDESTFYRRGSWWDMLPHKSPIWNADNSKTFEVITGDGSTPARLIRCEEDKENVSQNLILQVPIDYKDSFERNLLDSIRDIAGCPTSSENKYIHNKQFITGLFDNPVLRNVEHMVIADTSDRTKNLIFNRVKNVMFYETAGKYRLKRAPHVPRYIGIDLAHSKKGDLAGVCMVHPELLREGDTLHVVYVVDFAFAIAPGDNGIRLDAITEFILDLFHLGGVNIGGILYDTFQSEYMHQRFKDYKIPAEKHSVDKSIHAYQELLTLLSQGRIKSGKNIFLKNNLESLYVVRQKTGREKVDHSQGTVIKTYDGNFENSNCGIHAKDVSDALAQAIIGALDAPSDYSSCMYDEENNRFKELIRRSQQPPSEDKAFKGKLLHMMNV